MRRMVLVVGLFLMWLPCVRAEEKPAETRTVAVNADELEGLHADAKKMQVMINQMRTNLAFVTSTTTPLGHQFQLEIDMWQVVLDQMNRRIARMEQNSTPAK